MRATIDVFDGPRCSAEERQDHQAGPFAIEMIEAWLKAFDHVRQLRQKIAEKPSRVFFYPACRFDWNPLVLFSACCDTFIYCDPNPQPEDFEKEVRTVRSLDGLALGAVQPMNLADLRLERTAFDARLALTADQQARYDRACQVWTGREGWARHVQMSQNHGAVTRRLHLYYLCAEGYATYVNLFTEAAAAPKVICLKGAHDCDKNWAEFLKWESPLGRAVAASGRPEIVVVHRSRDAGLERSDNWPWRRHRETYEAWEAAAFGAGAG